MICEDKTKNQYLNNESYCNCCGEKIAHLNNQISKTEYLHVQKSWGYFSEYDMENHEFNICQKCYSKFINSFAIPVQVNEYDDFVGDDIYIYSQDEIQKLNNAYKESAIIKKAVSDN